MWAFIQFFFLVTHFIMTNILRAHTWLVVPRPTPCPLAKLSNIWDASTRRCGRHQFSNRCQLTGHQFLCAYVCVCECVLQNHQPNDVSIWPRFVSKNWMTMTSTLVKLVKSVYVRVKSVECFGSLTWSLHSSPPKNDANIWCRWDMATNFFLVTFTFVEHSGISLHACMGCIVDVRQFNWNGGRNLSFVH